METASVQAIGYFQKIHVFAHKKRFLYKVYASNIKIVQKIKMKQDFFNVHHFITTIHLLRFVIKLKTMI